MSSTQGPLAVRPESLRSKGGVVLGGIVFDYSTEYYSFLRLAPPSTTSFCYAVQAAKSEPPSTLGILESIGHRFLPIHIIRGSPVE